MRTTAGRELTVLATATALATAAVDRSPQVLADAMTLVRDLVNTSPSHLSPATFAAEARAGGGRAAGLPIEVLDEKALADGGYGGITGVGQGSVHPPRLVRLAYRHPEAQQDRGVRRQGHHVRLRRPVAEAAEGAWRR